MDKIDALRTFVRVVERRSFAQAAQDLKIPRSRVSETIKQLERHLGVRLLTRTTRQVMPTAEGEEYCRRCLGILADMDDADEAVTKSVPAGPLRIDVHGTFARHFLLPDLPRFLDAFPGIQLHVGESDRLVDLIGEGIDCVIRIGEPDISGLIGRRLGVLEEGTFASPAYLERHGIPQSFDDLGGHRMVAFVSTKTRSIIPLEFKTGDGLKIISVPVSTTVNAGESMACLAIHGMGIIQVPRYRLRSEIRDGLIVEILASFAPSATPVYMLHPEGRHVSARARAFMNWAAPLLTSKLAEQ
jgi:DNA-binding transcriptional LysR family regulator